MKLVERVARAIVSETTSKKWHNLNNAERKVRLAEARAALKTIAYIISNDGDINAKIGDIIAEYLGFEKPYTRITGLYDSDADPEDKRECGRLITAQLQGQAFSYTPPNRNVIIVANTVERARIIAHERGISSTYATSPRSIRQGFGRGMSNVDILIDESAWPLPDDVLGIIMPCLLSGGVFRRLSEVSSSV